LPVYTYKALDAQGTNRTGTIDAASEATAVARLADDGLFVSSISAGLVAPGTRARPVKARKLAAFTRQLATLLVAGVSLARALETISSEEADESFRSILADVQERIHGGESLSEAFGAHPRVFSKLYVSLIRVGEAGGVLDRMCAELAGFQERDAEVRANVSTALIYPTVVVVLGVSVVFVFMTFVFPRLLEPFVQMNVVLPLPTRIVQAVSFWLWRWWWLLALALVGCVFAYQAYVAKPGGRDRIDKMKLSVPAIGPFLLNVAMMRFSMTLATLVRCGVPVVDGLEIVVGVLGNEHLGGRLSRAIEEIRRGGGIAEKLLSNGFLPPMAGQMVLVGEESGRLDDVLGRMAESYDAEVGLAVRRLEAVLAPAVIVVVAVFIAFIVISVMLPVLDIGSSLGM